MILNDLFSSVISIVYLVVVSVGVGSFILQRSKIYHELNIAIHYFLGLIVISNAFILLSLLLPKPYNFITLVVFLTIFIKSGISLLVDRIRSLKFKFSEHLNFTDIFLLLSLVVMLSIFFLHSFAKPTGWDEIVYHIPVVKEISNGNVSFPLLSNSPFIDFYQPFSKLYGNFPYAVESFAAFAYSISGNLEFVAGLVFLINYLFFCIYLFSFLKKRLGVIFSSSLAVIILLTLSKGFSQLLSTVYIDIDIAIYEFIALTLLFYPKTKSQVRVRYLSAVFLGFALGSKYSAIYFLPVYIILFLITSIKLKLNNMFVHLSLAGLFAFVSGGFWYIKNLILFYNPIFPFIFGGKDLSKLEFDFIVRTQMEPRKDINLLGLFETLKTNVDFLLIVLVFFVSIVAYLTIKKLSKLNILIYFSFASMMLFVINFFIGNQSSRYILLSSMLTISLIPVLFSNNKLAMLILVVISFLYTFKTPILAGIWISRIDNIKHLFASNYENYVKNNVGCSSSVASFLSSNVGQRNTLNLWDPYTAIYYEDSELFVGYKDLSNDNLSDMKYVFINEQYKSDFLNTKDYHSDMNIDERLAIENKIMDNSSVVFSKNKCFVYEVKH